MATLTLWQRLSGLGQGLWSQLSEGTAKAVASFAERLDRQAALIRVERSGLPRGKRTPEPKTRHQAGERAFSSMTRGAGGIGWPGSWTSNRALQVTQFRHWVYVAVDTICSRIAALPPRLGFVRPRRRTHGLVQKSVASRRNRRPKSQRRRARQAVYKAFLRQRFEKSLHAIKPHEAIEDVGPEHPLARLLVRPNAWDLSPGQLWYELVLFLCLTGNAYLWVVPDQLFGKPLELWVIPSQWVWGPRLGPAGPLYYEILPYVGGGGSFRVPADEIVHFSTKNPLNKIDGWAALQAGAEWVDVAESIDQSRYFAMQNGSQASGAIELGPKYDPDDIDIDAIGAKFLARYAGVRNAGVPVITPPDAKFVPLTIAPAEMAFETGFEQLRDSVLALYRVPKEVAGIQDAGSEIAMYGPMKQFNEGAIFPKLRLIGEVFTAAVCRRWDDDLRLWWEDHSPPDPQQVNANLNTDYQHGLRTINEGRTERGLPPRREKLADELLVNPNLMPLGMLEQRLQQQAQPPQAPPDKQPAQQEPARPPPDANDRTAAEQAALKVNDRAWQDHAGAVRKAARFNRQFAAAGSPHRLHFDDASQRWQVNGRV